MSLCRVLVKLYPVCAGNAILFDRLWTEGVLKRD